MDGRAFSFGNYNQQRIGQYSGRIIVVVVDIIHAVTAPRCTKGQIRVHKGFKKFKSCWSALRARLWESREWPAVARRSADARIEIALVGGGNGSHACTYVTSRTRVRVWRTRTAKGVSGKTGNGGLKTSRTGLFSASFVCARARLQSKEDAVSGTRPGSARPALRA